MNTLHYNADGSLVDLFIHSVMQKKQRREAFQQKMPPPNPIFAVISQALKENKWRPRVEDLHRLIKMYFDNLKSFADGFKQVIDRINDAKKQESQPAPKIPQVKNVDAPLDEDDVTMIQVISAEKKKGETVQKSENKKSKETIKNSAYDQIKSAEDFYRKDTDAFNRNVEVFEQIRPILKLIISAADQIEKTVARLSVEVPALLNKVNELKMLHEHVKQQFDRIGGYKFVTDSMRNALNVYNDINKFVGIYNPQRNVIISTIEAYRKLKESNPTIPNGYLEAKTEYDRIQKEIEDVRKEASSAAPSQDTVENASMRKQRLQGELLNLRRNRESSSAIIASPSALAALDADIKAKEDAIKQIDDDATKAKSTQNQFQSRIRNIESVNRDAIKRYNDLKTQYDENLQKDEADNARMESNKDFIKTVDDAVEHVRNTLNTILLTLMDLNAGIARVKSDLDAKETEYNDKNFELSVALLDKAKLSGYMVDVKEMMKLIADYDADKPKLPQLVRNFFEKKSECRAAVDSF